MVYESDKKWRSIYRLAHQWIALKVLYTQTNCQNTANHYVLLPKDNSCSSCLMGMFSLMQLYGLNGSRGCSGKKPISTTKFIDIVK